MFRRIDDVLRPASPAQRDAGLSLVEVIVAMMVFTIISIGVAYTITNSLVLTRESRARAVATNLAAQEIDLLRSVDDVFSVVSKTWVTEVGGTTFTIARSAEWTTSATNSTACGTGTGTLQYKRVEVSVTYAGQRTVSAPITSATVLAPNGRINDPAKGTIVVSVIGASGAGTEGVTATVKAAAKDPNGAVAPPALDPTDSSGCTYALKVAPGNYDVTISKAGMVGLDQAATQTTTPVTVSAGGAGTASFSYDTAISLQTNFATNFPSPVVLPGNLDVTFRSSVMGDYTMSAAATKPAKLFPFSGGYAVVAGKHLDPSTDPKTNVVSSCLSPDPAAWVTPAADKAIGAAPVPVGAAPGGSATVGVPMGVLQLSKISGTVKVVAVQQKTGAAGDPGCLVPSTYTFAAVTKDTLLALPFGTWSFYTVTDLLNLGLITSSNQVNPQDSVLRTRGSIDMPTKTITLDPRGLTP
ncbi:type II secretion system protein [Frigoribacterium sp. CFBP 8766]|jgi:type II secretory pathway pseudopilin PulG|uniref:type II secretion system protein n=1 Tax=Frigoribacterium sp. CFBP 8766 TaxID=2775273 RepID=UPI001786879C|nr:type II secretion system protein [Frigoribacterium sp. CFBP 8766]MBD8583264.1 type II secretion system protein [Frigoribacterium sp. CFBP 8766]